MDILEELKSFIVSSLLHSLGGLCYFLWDGYRGVGPGDLDRALGTHTERNADSDNMRLRHRGRHCSRDVQDADSGVVRTRREVHAVYT